MNTIELGGLRLAYDDSHCGAGSTSRPGCAAVLLHGWGHGKTTMRPLAAGLAGRFRTVALDQPGHGDSDPPPGSGRATDLLSVPGQAGTTAALLDRLGIAAAVLVGHSSGGAVAVELAARRPDLVCAVVGLDATILLAPEVLAAADGISAALRRSDWRDAMAARIRRSYRATDDPALMTAELRQLARMSHEVFAAVPQTLRAWDDQAALRALAAHDIPMLYVDASAMVRLGDLSRLVPQARIEQVIGLGHMQLIGHPELAVTAMTEFFDDTSSVGCCPCVPLTHSPLRPTDPAFPAHPRT